MSDMLVKHDLLAILAKKLFEAGGLTSENASIISNDLVAANLRGLDSHGVSRIPMYLERIRKGVVNPNPNITFTQITTAVGLVDGDNGMGFLAGHRAMNEAIMLAENSGIGMVGVRRSTHYGMAALYVLQALDQGYISMAYTNSSPALPVYGGRNAFLGASPFAAGFPSGNESPYVLDMAMTIIARGKIRLAAAHGEEIPLGLALDANGAPTTNAQNAFKGVCLPFGGTKGAAMAMLMDLFAGVFTGANYGGDVKSLYFDHSEPQNVGHIFIAIRPDLFVTKEEYEQRMDTFVKRAKSCPLAEGFDDIQIPGEPEEKVVKVRRESGIPLSKKIYETLKKEAEHYHIDLSDFEKEFSFTSK
ncbi:Ldh family oxidoreductase [Metabacillus bambusae]|uniref:Ldh family oxidoreductase n=1 Tax=Metabacillus bambusae TaxID=2795218 RepID=A0ABS3N0B0_9BACI|nr:Ldh family oxidoreductase [Metabacillus bambusae]MBO1511510.1 Ldh family oxidoreductase [Metabacillus bambusae]